MIIQGVVLDPSKTLLLLLEKISFPFFCIFGRFYGFEYEFLLEDFELIIFIWKQIILDIMKKKVVDIILLLVEESKNSSLKE